LEAFKQISPQKFRLSFVVVKLSENTLQKSGGETPEEMRTEL
jgi:hypothetical protein